MKTQRGAHPGRTASPSAARVIAIAATFVLLGYGGFEAFAKHPAPASTKAATLAAGPTVTATGNDSEAPPPSAVPPSILDAQSEPRECDATKGITDNCVFE